MPTTLGGFICTFSLLISLSIKLRTSKFKYQFTNTSKYFDMASYLKQETYSGPVSFEVQRNDIDSVISDTILVQQHWELELVTESQLGEVQMKPPYVGAKAKT